MIKPKEVELLIIENEKLKQLAKKQRRIMMANRNKEDKIMRLLYAIRKKGIDVEQIYNE